MQIQAGTIIAGTLRNEDLLVALSQELDAIRGDSKAHHRLVSDALNMADLMERQYYLSDGRNADEGEASEIVNELFNALNEYAPDGMYFGAVEGDGADFGWWYESEA